MNSILVGYSFLMLAIIFVVMGTTFLMRSKSFTKLIPTTLKLSKALIYQR